MDASCIYASHGAQISKAVREYKKAKLDAIDLPLAQAETLIQMHAEYLLEVFRMLSRGHVYINTIQPNHLEIVKEAAAKVPAHTCSSYAVDQYNKHRGAAGGPDPARK